MTDGMTEKDRKSQLLDFGLNTKVSIQANPYTIQLKCDDEDSLLSKFSDAMLPRKTSKDILQIPVPRTNTGAQGENPKVSERTMVKELGKMTP